MALFELDDGRLVPAQFGREVRGGFTPDVLRAVRSQVLEIVSRPLFPITWRDIGGGRLRGRAPRLTALDASGQVVAVEVVQNLDSELLIDSLSALADTASMSWIDLAREYPGQIEGFKVDWAQFRESMPPSTPNGPRLVIVAASIDSEVRPALDVLASSGVEVHEMSLRQMTNGRAFLDVSAVGPRTYGHRANLLVSDANPVPELRERGQRQTPGAPASGKRVSSAPAPRTLPKPARPTPPRQPRLAPPAPSPTPQAGDVLWKRVAPPESHVPYPTRSERHARPEQPEKSPAPLPLGPAALLVVAEELGRPTRLVLDGHFGLDIDAELAISGLIHTRAGNFADPTKALEALGFGGVNGWEAWHLGDGYGPTLAEAARELGLGK